MNLHESMLLWLPTSPEANQNESLIEKVSLANRAILDFCNGEISLENALEAIEYYGANVDIYRDNLDECLRTLGV